MGELIVLGKFDVRDDICLKVGNFKHGQIIENAYADTYTVVGVQQDNRQGTVGLWAQKDGHGFATLLPWRPSEMWCNKGKRCLQEARDLTPETSLESTFTYPAGEEKSVPEKFDVTALAISHFGFKHGEMVLTEHSKLATVIGVRKFDGELCLWCHTEGDEGAVPIPRQRHMRKLGCC